LLPASFIHIFNPKGETGESCGKADIDGLSLSNPTNRNEIFFEAVQKNGEKDTSPWNIG
jgi:hypothetical protein